MNRLTELEEGGRGEKWRGKKKDAGGGYVLMFNIFLARGFIINARRMSSTQKNTFT